MLTFVFLWSARLLNLMLASMDLRFCIQISSQTFSTKHRPESALQSERNIQCNTLSLIHFWHTRFPANA